MKRLRLISVAHSYAVELNRRLAHEMARAGGDRWEVVAVAPKRFQGTRDLRAATLHLHDAEPCQVESVPAIFTSQVHCFLYGLQLRKLLAESWDVIHCWEEPYILAGWQITRWARPKSVVVMVTAQNWSKNYPPPFNWTERATMRRAAGWIPFGQTIVEALRERPGYCNRPYRLIPMGVDTEIFRPDRQGSRALRTSFGWAHHDDPPVVGYLGRFVQEKGLYVLMNALDRQTDPWRALFVGAGPLESKLREWASGHGDRVRIRTDVNHAGVPPFLNAMDMLCAPSQTTPRWREQFGRMTIEAFACGVPVIGSDSGEIPHVIGDAGLVVSESDEAAWANAIRSLLQSPERRRELGRRGRERAMTKYSWPVVAKQHLDFFESLLGRRQP